jgi:hypothetical protein
MRRIATGRVGTAAAVVVAATLTAACAGDGSVGVRDQGAGTERRVEFDREFTMAVNEIVVVDDTPVLIFFDRVDGDSRCPTGVTCVWEGNAEVRLEFSSQIAEFAPQARVLNTSLEPRSVSVLGVTVRLVDVAPYPQASGPPIDPASYVVRLIASRS